MASRRDQWLVVGHGSVGSFVAARLAGAGGAVSVLDPRPRIPIAHGEAVEEGAIAHRAVDYVVSCVPREAAETVPALVEPALRPEGMFFDWNTVSPTVKRTIRDRVTAATIDVALLDSLDTAVERPNLAVSGRGSEQAVRILEAHGFNATTVGEEVGEAAALKYLRSIFMKVLEALVLEYSSLASGFEGEAIVRASLESNLGEKFVRFMDLLVATNRIHAERRSRELADALALFSADGFRPELAPAAVDVLRRAADAWSDDSAPPVDAAIGVLTDHLRRNLWREPAST